MGVNVAHGLSIGSAFLLFSAVLALMGYLVYKCCCKQKPVIDLPPSYSTANETRNVVQDDTGTKMLSANNADGGNSPPSYEAALINTALSAPDPPTNRDRSRVNS